MMEVYLFSDYLKSINGNPLQADQSICDIDELEQLPDGLVRVAGRLARVCMISKRCAYIEYMGEIPKKDEVSFSLNITCPHCGDVDKDSWDAPDSDYDIECGACGSVFSYERHIEVTYSSKIIKRNDDVLELN